MPNLWVWPVVCIPCFQKLYYHPTILVVGWEKNKSNSPCIANTVWSIQPKGVDLKPLLEVYRDQF